MRCKFLHTVSLYIEADFEVLLPVAFLPAGWQFPRRDGAKSPCKRNPASGIGKLRICFLITRWQKVTLESGGIMSMWYL